MFTFLFWLIAYLFTGFISIILIELLDGPLENKGDYATAISVLLLWPLFWFVFSLVGLADGARFLVRLIRKQDGTRK